MRDTMPKQGSRMFVYNAEKKAFVTTSQTDCLVIAPEDMDCFNRMLEEAASLKQPAANYATLRAQTEDGGFANYYVGVICVAPGSDIIITLTETSDVCLDSQKIDSLTGLLNRNGLSAWVDEHEEIFTDIEDEKYMVVYFDVQRFKVVNEMYGLAEGDRLLKYIGEVVAGAAGEDGVGCHLDSDRFVIVVKRPPDKRDLFVDTLLDEILDFDLPFEVSCNAGIYVTTKNFHSADTLVDRAIIAQSLVKGSYTKRFNYYTEELRKNLLTEQEIIGMMRAGLRDEQFVIYYQPQYDHATGKLVGAEALVRWQHPEKGLISPGLFIPVFEKNGFITQLDLYVFEKVCQFLRFCLDEEMVIVPISTNLTRHDFFYPNFIDTLEGIRKKYDIPPEFIRLEITESVALGNSQFINEAMERLHSYGYVVEMDDFGSGYSSLNILKDIDFDIIKLDMRFLENGQDEANRGGTILSSVVRMVNWLGVPVIAEGVETVSQANFLKSIGCNYIQGFLYSKPLPEDEYKQHISMTNVGVSIPQKKLLDTLDAGNFFANDSLEELIFNNFVGGAAIFDYRDGKLEIVRVNESYLSELGLELSEKDVMSQSPLDGFDDEGRENYLEMLERAIETGTEQECETWRTLTSADGREERLCVRSNVIMVGKSKDAYLFYARIRNITSEIDGIAVLPDLKME